jgi:hypothetical protein
LTSIAAGVCVLAACGARAQITNNVVFQAVTVTQGTNGLKGTNTFFGPPKTASHNTANFLQEVGRAVLGEGNHFSSAAKLVLINGNGSKFAVIDGANFYDISSIMSADNQVSTNKVKSGTQNGNGGSGTGLAFPTIKKTELLVLNYDDTGTALGSSGLQFTIVGIATSSTTDSTPNGVGIYTETFKATLKGMGSGVDQNGEFVVPAASLTVSGTGTLSL